MSRIVTFTIIGGQIDVKSPFEAKEIIKDTVPSWLRTWSKTRKVWVIDASMLMELARALQAAGYTVKVIDLDAHRTPPPPPRTPQRHWVDQAFDAAPRDKWPTLRRLLMKVFHPDVGGDPDIAKKITAKE